MSTALTPYQEDLLFDATMITTGLSLVGEIMMIYYYFTDERNRKFPMKGIFGIVFCDFVYSLANLLIFLQNSSFWCSVQGYLRELSFNYMEFLSTLALKMSYMHLDPAHTHEVETLYPKYMLYIFVIASIPANLTLISAVFNGPFYFDHPLGFCDLDPPLYSVYILWVPVTLNIMFSVYYGLHIRRIMKKKAHSEKYGRKILIYPVIVIITTIPATVDRVIFSILGRPFFPSIMVHVIFLRLSGIFNAFAYRWTVKPRTRKEIKNISLVPNDFQVSVIRGTIVEEGGVFKSQTEIEEPSRNTQSLENSVIENLKNII